MSTTGAALSEAGGRAAARPYRVTDGGDGQQPQEDDGRQHEAQHGDEGAQDVVFNDVRDPPAHCIRRRRPRWQEGLDACATVLFGDGSQAC